MTKHVEMSTEEFKALARKSQTEDKLQKDIVQALEARGYLVLVTTHRVRKCQHCHKFPGGGQARYGASKGVTDLLVRDPKWMRATWVTLEVKKVGPIAWSSPEQQALAEAGHIVVVQSVEEALAFLGKK